MEILDGKKVAEEIKQTFEKRIQKLKSENKAPHLAVLGIKGDEASSVYVKRIEKNCIKYGIEITIKIAENEYEFIENFNKIKQDKNITGIMFQEPLPKNLSKLINEIPSYKEIEGIGITNIGKLFLGEKDVLIPCTSNAVIKTLEYYKIDLTGKKLAIVGRSNIVGKPLIPLILSKNATITICHSKTENIKEELSNADVIIMAIGKAKFLKRDFIKKDAILIDVGINFEDNKMVGDIDFEDIKEKASMCTPVPGGIGTITNTLLIDNVIKALEFKN